MATRGTPTGRIGDHDRARFQRAGVLRRPPDADTARRAARIRLQRRLTARSLHQQHGDVVLVESGIHQGLEVGHRAGQIVVESPVQTVLLTVARNRIRQTVGVDQESTVGRNGHPTDVVGRLVEKAQGRSCRLEDVVCPARHTIGGLWPAFT